MAEINDFELAELRKLQAFHKSLYDDAAVGMDFRKLIRRKYPQASIPELDALAKAEETGSAIEKKFEELSKGATEKIDKFLTDRQKEQDDAAVAAYQERFDKMVKARGYTEDGQKKLIELMKAKGIREPEDAAIIFETMQPKIKPAAKQFSSRMAFVSPDGKDDESFKDLMRDPDQWMGDQLMTAIAENHEEE